MRLKMSPEVAVTFIKWSAHLIFSWPLPVTATKRKKNIFTVLWYLTLLSISHVLFSLLYSIYEYRHNLLIVVTSTGYATTCATGLLRCILYKIHIKRIQSLIREMENFLIIAQPQERKILESYVQEWTGCQLTVILISFLAVLFTICAPIFRSDQKFPTSAVYPFSIDSDLFYYLMYLHQSIVTIQVCAASYLGSLAALLLWFVASRFEMLAQELQTVRYCSELITIVKKHQRLLRSSKKATNLMSKIIFFTFLSGCIRLLTGCLILVDKYPLGVKMQVAPITVIGMTWPFICAWPADNLINTCNLVGTAAYNSQWPDMTPEMRKNILLVIQRSQRPVIVSIGGFIPTLSLRYYGCFLSAAVSYLMALRVIIGID